MFKKTLIATALFATTSFAANASMVGDYVYLAHDHPYIGNHYLGPFGTLVQEGDADKVYIDGLYTVDFEAESIWIDFIKYYYYGQYDVVQDYQSYPKFEGLSVWDMDWVGNPYGRIVGGIIDTNIVGWSDDRFTWDEHSVALNFAGLHPSYGDYLHVDLKTDHKVPEPAALALFGFALAGAGLARRKKLATKSK